MHPRRVIVNAILHVNRTGCAWRYLPADFPPWRTVYGYFAAWRDNGVLHQIHDQLRDAARATTPPARTRESASASPTLNTQPPCITAGHLQARQIRQKPVLSGLINEYVPAA